MAANRQTCIHTHARAQCSHASVGLVQARPNYQASWPQCALVTCPACVRLLLRNGLVDKVEFLELITQN